MKLFVSYLAIGFSEGLIYALLAMGMVLIYKGSRTINFAHPYFGLLTAFVCWWLTGSYFANQQNGASFFPFNHLPFHPGTLPRFAIAVVLSLAFIGLYGYGIEHGVMRRLRRAPRLVTLVATIAIAQGVLGLVTILFARTQKQQGTPRPLPELLKSWHFVLGARDIKGNYIMVLIVTVVVCAAAAYFFNRTKFGVAVRAAAENGDAARLLGISADRVASFVWVAGAMLAGIAGILVSEVTGGVDVTTLSLGFLVRGLTAALIGGLTSLPGALAGGLIVGITEKLLAWKFNSPSQFGLPELVLFLFVIAVLIFKPGGLFGRREDTEDKVGFVPVMRELPSRLRASTPANLVRVVSVVIGLIIVVVSWNTGSATAGLLSRTLSIAIVGVGLTVLMGYAGQISLGHWALAGVGAFTTANFVGRAHVPFLLALILAIAVGMVVSLIIGLPALRIRGPYLAIVTLGFNLACQQYLFHQTWLGGSSAGRDFDRPKLGPLNLANPNNRPLLLFTVICLLLAIVVARNLAVTRTGRALFALRENEKAAATLGVRLTRYKLLAFAVSGGIAALGGALYATSLTRFDRGDYTAPFSLVLIAIVMVGGLGSPWGAVFGAFLIDGMPRLVQLTNPWIVPIGTGVLLITVIVWVRGGVAGMFATLRERFVVSMDHLMQSQTPPADATVSPRDA